MKTSRTHPGLMVLALLVSSPAAADFESSITCPLNAASASTITADIQLENEECEAATVRIISSILGNVDDTAGGLGVFGPVVADPSVAVPAATDLLPGTCTNPPFGTCAGTSGPGAVFCSADSDCVCEVVTPGIANISIPAPPTLPTSLVGTVASYLFVTEWETTSGKTETGVAECLVNVLP